MDLRLNKISTNHSADIKNIKILILGSGPAGLSAALYAARANLEPIVLTGMELGGQVSLTNTIENYPGFPEGVGGQELVELFQKQAERFGAHIEYDTATDVDLKEHPFRIKTYNYEYLADTLIVATGAQATQLDVPGEKELTGRGVSYCATCDGWFFKDKDVVVVGGGDSAIEESLFLTRYAKSITIIHRRDSLRAGVILQQRALSHPKIKFIWDSIIAEIMGEETVQESKNKEPKDPMNYESFLRTVCLYLLVTSRVHKYLQTRLPWMNTAISRPIIYYPQISQVYMLLVRQVTRILGK